MRASAGWNGERDVVDEFEEALGLGLSAEEKDDLEALIRASRTESTAPAGDMRPEDLKKRIATLSDQVGQLAGIILEMDERMNLLYRIVQLSHRKSELMHGRLDALLARKKRRRTRP
ncbi:MAG: hypothetical protein P8020_02215 [Acidobacteriota bacterium]|jgi:hypothetical protein